MTIREYAREVGHEVVGKLTRRKELEYKTDYYTGKRVWSGYKTYTDEALNEYDVKDGGVCIVTFDGGVI